MHNSSNHQSPDKDTNLNKVYFLCVIASDFFRCTGGFLCFFFVLTRWVGAIISQHKAHKFSWPMWGVPHTTCSNPVMKCIQRGLQEIPWYSVIILYQNRFIILINSFFSAGNVGDLVKYMLLGTDKDLEKKKEESAQSKFLFKNIQNITCSFGIIHCRCWKT